MTLLNAEEFSYVEDDSSVERGRIFVVQILEEEDAVEGARVLVMCVAERGLCEEHISDFCRLSNDLHNFLI